MFRHLFDSHKQQMPTAQQALPGRATPMKIHNRHFVSGQPLQPPFPEGMEQILFGLGCFWGAERLFWQLPGVFTTAAGYSGGFTPNPSYEEVCSGRTGHNEVVLVVFEPALLPLPQLLQTFWESHDPTQGMRQGNDVGTQYRSGIYTFSAPQQAIAEKTKQQYEARLLQSGYQSVTTEIIPAGEFYYAEDYHQQYLAKNPAGYCGIGGTGICFQENPA